MNKKLYYNRPKGMCPSFSENCSDDGLIVHTQDIPIDTDIHTEDIDVKLKCGIPIGESSISLPDIDAAEDAIEKLSTDLNNENVNP
jgi:hypothetical protein